MPVGVPGGINIGGGGIVSGATHIVDTIQGINSHHQQPPLKRAKVWPSKEDQQLYTGLSLLYHARLLYLDIAQLITGLFAGDPRTIECEC